MSSLQELIHATKNVRTMAIVALGALALFLLVETVTIVQDFGRPAVPATDTITISADGQATKAPDVARLSFTVENTATAVSDAQTKTVDQANKAIEYLKEQGIALKDVKTLSYTIDPQYSYPRPCTSGDACPLYVEGTPKITGYQVAESIQVTVHDLTKVGTILGGLGGLEVQNVSGPDFALDDESAGYDAARADAIDKAQAQAKLLADQLGVHLAKIVGFSESSGYRAYPVAYAMKDSAMGASSASATPTTPTGENTYTASVSITYEIR